MSRNENRTITFDCDWKCGASVEVNPKESSKPPLNYAGAPHGWEVVRVDKSSVMTTAAYIPAPAYLCPDCYGLFKLCSQGGATLRGKLFRAYLSAFKAAEDELKNIQENHITTTAAVVKGGVGNAPLGNSAIDSIPPEWQVAALGKSAIDINTFNDVAVFGDDDEPDDPQPNHDPYPPLSSILKQESE